MINTLYITRNGLCEPLGQSQVMAYLKGLSSDFSITVITFEKPKDLDDVVKMAQARAECDAHGIKWLPQRFRYKPQIIAPALSMIVFLWLCLRAVRQGNARLIHARSYVPAAVALVVHRMTGTPFVFDMRALWPEELITAGRLRRGSMLHRIIVAVERACLRHAAAVVSLTHAAEDHLRDIYPAELKGQTIFVIPTCADLDRFVPLVPPHGGQRVYGCLGTVLSGWFRLDWLAAFYQTAARQDPTARFEIVTRDAPAVVRAAIGGGADLQDRLLIFACPSQTVHTAVQRHSVSVMFYAGGAVSELGRAPTRMAEVLGSGLPVVANAGVGDVARIITAYQVGVLVADNSPAAMQAAFNALAALMADPALAARCRHAAEDVFSLTRGTENYRGIYLGILKDQML